MNAYGFIGVLGVVLGIIKEVLIIFLLVKGIKVANVYLQQNENKKIDNGEVEE